MSAFTINLFCVKAPTKFYLGSHMIDCAESMKSKQREVGCRQSCYPRLWCGPFSIVPRIGDCWRSLPSVPVFTVFLLDWLRSFCLFHFLFCYVPFKSSSPIQSLWLGRFALNWSFSLLLSYSPILGCLSDTQVLWNVVLRIPLAFGNIQMYVWSLQFVICFINGIWGI